MSTEGPKKPGDVVWLHKPKRLKELDGRASPMHTIYINKQRINIIVGEHLPASLTFKTSQKEGERPTLTAELITRISDKMVKIHTQSITAGLDATMTIFGQTLTVCILSIQDTNKDPSIRCQFGAEPGADIKLEVV